MNGIKEVVKQKEITNKDTNFEQSSFIYSKLEKICRMQGKIINQFQNTMILKSIEINKMVYPKYQRKFKIWIEFGILDWEHFRHQANDLIFFPSKRVPLKDCSIDIIRVIYYSSNFQSTSYNCNRFLWITISSIYFSLIFQRQNHLKNILRKYLCQIELDIYFTSISKFFFFGQQKPHIHINSMRVYDNLKSQPNIILLLLIIPMERSKGSIFNQSRSFAPPQLHRQSCDEYKLVKVLPHIKEEFHYRVENRLMVQKIIHPRRDKTIVNSLTNTSYKSFSRKKKLNRKNTSIDHRRKTPLSGFIKKQIRPHTSDFQSTAVICPAQTGDQFRIWQHSDKKECFSIMQEKNQSANPTSKCRWLTADSNYLRESSIGKIIKNSHIKTTKSSKQTVKTINNNGKMENSVTLPCEIQKKCNQKKQRIALMNQYMRICGQNINKLQKRAFLQHFHNKENIFQCQTI